jgi:hypothetical protein
MFPHLWIHGQLTEKLPQRKNLSNGKSFPIVAAKNHDEEGQL